jgi:hypothetical protein
VIGEAVATECDDLARACVTTVDKGIPTNPLDVAPGLLDYRLTLNFKVSEVGRLCCTTVGDRMRRVSNRRIRTRGTF